MAINGLKPRSDFEQKLQAMKDSKLEFHLTGSRFFGTTGPDSDWDFFVQNSDKVSQDLREMGFFQVADTRNFGSTPMPNPEGPDYFDRGCVGVFTYGEGKEGIHIQVVKDAILKQKIQEEIKKSPILRLLTTKSSISDAGRKEFWNFAFKMVELGEKRGNEFKVGDFAVAKKYMEFLGDAPHREGQSILVQSSTIDYFNNSVNRQNYWRKEGEQKPK